MTSAMLSDLLQSLGLLGLFLLIGMALRAVCKPLQKAFIPASVIGGFLLLILGPQVLNVLPVSEEWFSYYNLLPGVLIVPVVTAVPLGLHLQTKDGKGSGEFMKNVVPLIGIGVGISMLQFAIGYLTNMVFQGSYPDMYPQFGIELGIGFVGGHGTAGTLGNMLTELNLDYASVSQGVATTTATFGLVGGIVLGIVMINWAARKQHTAVLSKPADIPTPMKVGFEKDITKQGSAGRETTMGSSIDTLAFHAAIIFLGCWLAYIAVKFAKALNIPVLKSMSVWAYGMIIMFIIWGLMCKCKVDYLVDGKIKSRITGAFTEFAVIGAVASLPIKAVAAFILPILVMVALGFVVTVAGLLLMSKRFLKGYWFEQMIGTFGMATGVFITGVLLLRICDPENETPALASYSLSYTITSVIYFALLNLFIVLPMSYGAGVTALVGLALAAAFFLLTVVSSVVSFGKDFKGN